MDEYIKREATIDRIEGIDWYHISLQGNLAKGANSDINTPLYKADDIYNALKSIPAADVVEVHHRNTNDENCIICNSELDEKGAGGIWDLAGEICYIICPECDHEEQDTVYNIIRNYIESQSYCPNCGADMRGVKDE